MMAAFSLEEFESAKEAFENAQKLAPSSTNKTWIRKCEAELAEEEDAEGESSDDMNMVAPKSTSKPVPVNDGPPPLEPDADEPVTKPQSKPPSQPQTQTQKPSPTQTSNPTTQSQSTPQTTASNKVRYEWFQSETHITVAVFLKNVKKEDAKISILPTSLSIEVKLPNGSEYQLNIDLLDKIVPEESNVSFLSTKIELKLKKSNRAKWSTLENTGGNVLVWDSVSDAKKDKGLQYPSSSKHGTKDWDIMAKQQPEEKPEGDAALNKVFEDIFKNATDDQRRAMQKSFQESGGTVLSTNWDEVGKGSVKGHPPKGMDMKYWKDLSG